MLIEKSTIEISEQSSGRDSYFLRSGSSTPGLAGDLIDWGAAVAALCEAGGEAWAAPLSDRLAGAVASGRHADLEGWLDAVRGLPVIPTGFLDLAGPAITVGRPSDATDAERRLIHDRLQVLHPWRKGPFDLFGVCVDAEWRSDLKWARVAPHFDPLAGRRVLDVGCGNGYYGWRLCGAGAGKVVGIDPSLRCLAQHLAVARLLRGVSGGSWPFHFLPLALEDLPAGPAAFDTVLSMGVIYHRRNPAVHLARLRDLLRPGGQLVLEGLVVEDPATPLLVPGERYAKMRNVRSIPSPQRLLRWVEGAGFRDARVVDVTPTTVVEQRRTAWMRFESLADFLDAADPSRTVEGYPAPVRAVCVAVR
jgi:tRNA (mo5U34)-methyltransferase